MGSSRTARTRREPSEARPLGRLTPFLTNTALLFAANMGAVVLTEVMGPYVRTPDYFQLNSAVLESTASLIMALSFSIPTVIGTLYVVPIMRDPAAARAGLVPAKRAGRRLLSSPLFMGLLSILGWMINAAGFFAAAAIKGIETSTAFTVRLVMEKVFVGMLCFVMSYYALDTIHRRWFIPRYFGAARLSDYGSPLSPSVSTRFAVHFFAIAFFPLFIVTLYLLKLAGDSGSAAKVMGPYAVIASLLLVACAALSALLARSFRLPLDAMRAHAGRVGTGDYEGGVAVRTIDELGRLGEAMNDMTAGLRERERIRETFGRAVDPRVRDHLLDGGADRGGSVHRATILFCDIRGFTSISERLAPETVVLWLNRYFERMSACVSAEGGIVNKFIGDAVMAVFGVPAALPDHAGAALKAAVAMRKARAALNRELEADGFPPIHAGIGIHTGDVMAGTIGSSERMEYTVIGDAVNIAARIEKLCKTTGKDILASGATFAVLGPGSGLAFLGNAALRGKEDRIGIYWT